MPELTLPRADLSAPPFCMYCGAPASSRRLWRVPHTTDTNGGGEGASLTPAPFPDDPLVGWLNVLFLPVVIWDAISGLTRKSPPPPHAAKLSTPDTVVPVFSCARHRRFGDRFVLGWAAAVMLLAGLWVWAILEVRRVMGTDDVNFATTLLLTVVFLTVGLPLGLAVWRFVAGPVIVDRATADAVVLDRVRPAYFAAAKLTPPP